MITTSVLLRYFKHWFIFYLLAFLIGGWTGYKKTGKVFYEYHAEAIVEFPFLSPGIEIWMPEAGQLLNVEHVLTALDLEIEQFIEFKRMKRQTMVYTLAFRGATEDDVTKGYARTIERLTEIYGNYQTELDALDEKFVKRLAEVERTFASINAPTMADYAALGTYYQTDFERLRYKQQYMGTKFSVSEAVIKPHQIFLKQKAAFIGIGAFIACLLLLILSLAIEYYVFRTQE